MQANWLENRFATSQARRRPEFRQGHAYVVDRRIDDVGGVVAGVPCSEFGTNRAEIESVQAEIGEIRIAKVELSNGLVRTKETLGEQLLGGE